MPRLLRQEGVKYHSSGGRLDSKVDLFALKLIATWDVFLVGSGKYIG